MWSFGSLRQPGAAKGSRKPNNNNDDDDDNNNNDNNNSSSSSSSSSNDNSNSSSSNNDNNNNNHSNSNNNENNNSSNNDGDNNNDSNNDTTNNNNDNNNDNNNNDNNNNNDKGLRPVVTCVFLLYPFLSTISMFEGGHIVLRMMLSLARSVVPPSLYGSSCKVGCLVKRNRLIIENPLSRSLITEIPYSINMFT